MDHLANDELWALSSKVISLKIIGQCLQFFSLPVLILWVHTYVSILWRNLHQKVQSECVFLPLLRRDLRLHHTPGRRGAESVPLGRAPAEMQPSPVSVEGETVIEGGTSGSNISCLGGTNMTIEMERWEGTDIQDLGSQPYEVKVLGTG